MPAFRHWEIEGTVVITIEDGDLAAAFRAFAYAWEERPDEPARTRRLVDILDGLFREAIGDDRGGGRSQDGAELTLQ